jgi:NADH:ubiquinone oxidoreductase subunit F (NADH-binding)
MSTLLETAPARPSCQPQAAQAPRLLAGPRALEGPEDWEAHHERLGRRPVGGPWLLEVIDRSGLRGRGGAWFPTGRKWRSVAAASARRPAAVIVNASEGEPLSAKDRILLHSRPHLVLDGAMVAAEAVGADLVLIYVSRPSHAAARILRQALKQRRRAHQSGPVVQVVQTAHRYVAGESSSVVRRAGGGVAKPVPGPPHPSDWGLDGRPTLVQNVETLAHGALIARRGDQWFRDRGVADAPGTMLLTVSGDVYAPGVYEVDVGTQLTTALALAGGPTIPVSGVLIGGYFGSWLAGGQAAHTALTPGQVTLGCGVVGVVGVDVCPLREAAGIVSFLAAESAGQCGPCVHGLRAIADAMSRLAAGDADRGDLIRLDRWTAMVEGRGGCRHPDGAVHNVRSALSAFSADVERHIAGSPCPATGRLALATPRRHRGWR